MASLDIKKQQELTGIENQFQDNISNVNSILSHYTESGMITCNVKARSAELLEKIETYKDHITKKMVEIEGKIQDTRDEKAKDEKLKAGFESYMKDEKKKLKHFEDNKEKYYNLAKASVAEIDLLELKKIGNSKVNENLFKFLCKILYKENPNEFNFSSFRKIAFEKDPEDFQAKLAIFDMNKLNIDSLVAQEFNSMRHENYPDANKNGALNEILAWMDYIYETYLSTIEDDEQKKVILDSEVTYGKRITKVKESENVILSYQKAIEYLNNIITKFDNIDRSLHKIDNHDVIPEQDKSKDIVNKIRDISKMLQVPNNLYE